MALDKKILNEINRYRSINNYILEQDAEALDLGALTPEAGATPPPPPAEATATPPPPPPSGAEPIDVDNDPDVEKIDDNGKSEESKDKGSDSEELDITELVTAQKDIQSKQDDYFENLFGQLNKLESRLGEMDAIMNKLNALEDKIEKYKEDMEKTGKNAYVLTPDEVTDINVSDIKSSFQGNGFKDDSKY